MSVAEAQDDLELKQAVAVYLLAITDFIIHAEHVVHSAWILF